MKKILKPIIVLVSLLLIRQMIISICQLPPYIFDPWSVIHTLYLQFNLIISETKITVLETLLGLLLGIFLGSLAALTMVFFHKLKLWLLPILVVSQAIPTFAIAPLLVIWFGYGITSKIATTVIMLFFPVTSAFYDGLQRTPPEWIDLARTFPAKRWRFFG